MEVKACSKCKKVKSVEYFHKRKSSPNGYRGQCRDCRNKVIRIYKKKNSEKISNYYKVYRGLNKKKMLEYRKKWRDKNPDYNKQYYLENLEKINIYNKNYIKEFPEITNAGKYIHRKSITKEGFISHHWNYNKSYWADILFVTRSEHLIIHNSIYYDKELKMFRCNETHKILQKEDQINLINNIREVLK